LIAGERDVREGYHVFRTTANEATELLNRGMSQRARKGLMGLNKGGPKKKPWYLNLLKRGIFSEGGPILRERTRGRCRDKIDEKIKR